MKKDVTEYCRSLETISKTSIHKCEILEEEERTGKNHEKVIFMLKEFSKLMIDTKTQIREARKRQVG